MKRFRALTRKNEELHKEEALDLAEYAAKQFETSFEELGEAL